MRCFGRRREADTSFSFARLREADVSSASSHVNDLNTLIIQFGRCLLNVAPGDIPRLKEAVENDNTEEIQEIIGRTSSNNTPRDHETEFRSIDMVHESFFKLAVENCKTEWVEFFLDKIANKSIPFSTRASMIRESFNNLWLDYRSFLEEMMKKDALGWDVCTIEVPIETFTVESNLGTRVGTCDTVLNWIHSSRQGTSFHHWRSLDKKEVDKQMRKSRGRRVNAVVRIYCFEDTCQIGLDGIVRFLLMHQAPSYLFKAPLIKWVITYKWERIWKVIAFRRLASFLVLFVGFHIFVFYTVVDELSSIPSEGVTAIGLCFFTTLMILPIATLRREYFQLKRCILDGRKIFPSNWFQGIRIYFSSRPNQVDLMLSGVIVLYFVQLGLAIAGIADVAVGSPFIACFIVQLLFMWTKGFYLLQVFKSTGIFVVMIGRVLQECAPYFLLLFGITIGFGLAMRMAFLVFLQKEALSLNSREAYSKPKPSPSLSARGVEDIEEMFDEEDKDRAHTSFGSLYESILTMAYAMVGLFDPEVLFNCGPLRGLMIALFLLYLFLQTIVMFNMLIASMGDAFDGVRAAEEELVLMARARFIDQYEASLSNRAIRKMKTKIGKYLYVLMPEDKQLEENVSFWKGRIPTIKEDVKKIVKDSQNETSRNMSEMNQNLCEIGQNTNEMFKTLMDEIKGFKDDISCLKEQVMTLEQRVIRQDRDHFGH